MEEKNPFETLMFTPEMVKALQDKPRQLHQIAELHKRYLMGIFHPDLNSLNELYAKQLNEALDTIKDNFYFRDCVQKFLAKHSRKSADTLSRTIQDQHQLRSRVKSLQEEILALQNSLSFCIKEKNSMQSKIAKSSFHQSDWIFNGIFHDARDFKYFGLEHFIKSHDDTIICLHAYPDFKKTRYVYFQKSNFNLYEILIDPAKSQKTPFELIIEKLERKREKKAEEAAKNNEEKIRFTKEKIALLEYLIDNVNDDIKLPSVKSFQKLFMEYVLITPSAKNINIEDMMLKPSYNRLSIELNKILQDIISVLKRKNKIKDFQSYLFSKLRHLKHDLLMFEKNKYTFNPKSVRIDVQSVFSEMKNIDNQTGVLIGTAPVDNCPFPKAISIDENFIKQVTMISPTINVGEVLLYRHFPTKERGKGTIYITITPLGIIKEIATVNDLASLVYKFEKTNKD